MRLPDNSKDRTKVLILIGLGVLTVLFALAQGLLSLAAKRTGLKNKLVDMEWKLSSSRRDVSAAQKSEVKDQAIITEIVTVSDRYLLHSILGNYRLGATSIFEQHAKALGLELQSVQEVGILDLPQPSGKKLKNVFKAYAARAVLECNYFELLDFIGDIENENPFVCLVGLSLVGDSGKDPEKHRAVLTFQWPIWTDDATEERVVSRLAAKQESETGEHDG